MNVDQLIGLLRGKDIRLLACGEQLIVDAPTDAVSDEIGDLLITHKPELMAALTERAERHRPPSSPLADYAADRAPAIRCTVRETGDIQRDFTLLHRLRHVIEQHPPGANHVVIRVVPVDGRAQRIEWRAPATKDLRRDLARVLVEAALEDAANSATADDSNERFGPGAKASPALRAYSKLHPRSAA